jgi:hypothetical protein
VAVGELGCRAAQVVGPPYLMLWKLWTLDAFIAV